MLKNQIKLVKTAVEGSALAVIFLSNGIGTYAVNLNLNGVQASAVQQIEDKNEFLIDAPIKYYYDITKVQKYAGFNFKLPSHLETSIWKGGVDEYKLVKLSDTSNAIVMDYEYNEEMPKKVDRHQIGMRLMIFKDDPLKAIEQIEKLGFSNDINLYEKYEFKEIEKTYGNIKGKEVVADIISPYDDGGGAVQRHKYFVWRENSVYYAIDYDDASLSCQDLKDMQHMNVVRYYIYADEDEVNRIVNSFKEIDLISEVDYKKAYEKDAQNLYNTPEIKSIYDNDDLIKANEILGFKAKIPNKFSNKNVKIQKSLIGNLECSIDQGNKYMLNLNYTNGNEEINFTQSKYDIYNEYSVIKDKGYVDITDEYNNSGKLNVESFNVSGITVYKYIRNCASDNNDICYLWKDNDVYNTLNFHGALGYEDNIAKEFINFYE